jgi:hypothetical protein
MANAFKSETDTAVGTSGSNVYTCPAGSQTTIIGLTAANTTTSQVQVDVQLDASNRTSGAEDSVYLVKNAPVPVGSSLVVVGGEQKVVVEPGDVITVTSNVDSSVDVVLSVLEIT